ncbi:MAG: hypothetical protein EA397_15315 [Deltaproteobacteria bacterium]|nr:MAG: hypothetical protein EA397_15315 [Deltaproteobacteria bacterium]
MRSLILLLLLIGCDNFAEVRAADTIEAYEAYLETNPEGRTALEARTRLETLYIERARSERTLEAYDAYRERFPKGSFAKAAYEEREKHLWEWADTKDTPEAWQKYLDQYPSFEATKVRKAKKRKAAAEYRPQLSWTDPVAEQVNLAEDPEGPLNGWKVTSEITNNGDKILKQLTFTLEYLNDEGGRLGEESWPAASTNYGIPVEEFRKKPIKPGESRQWELLTGETPKGWSGKMRLKPTSISYKKLTAKD